MIKIYVLVMALYSPLTDETYIYTEKDFWSEGQCEAMGEEFMESKDYFDPVVGHPKRGYECVEISVIKPDLD